VRYESSLWEGTPSRAVEKSLLLRGTHKGNRSGVRIKPEKGQTLREPDLSKPELSSLKKRLPRVGRGEITLSEFASPASKPRADGRFSGLWRKKKLKHRNPGRESAEKGRPTEEKSSGIIYAQFNDLREAPSLQREAKTSKQGNLSNITKKLSATIEHEKVAPLRLGRRAR